MALPPARVRIVAKRPNTEWNQCHALCPPKLNRTAVGLTRPSPDPRVKPADDDQGKMFAADSILLKRRGLAAGIAETISIVSILVHASYRPFTVRWFYEPALFIDETGSAAEMFPAGKS